MTLFDLPPSPATVVQLEVTRVDRASWRISDSSIDERDPRRLLGFIERLERGRYEVLWLAPIGWAYLGTFDLALAALGDRAHFSGPVMSEREALVPKISPFHRIQTLPRYRRGTT